MIFTNKILNGIDSVIAKISNDQIFLNHKHVGYRPQSFQCRYVECYGAIQSILIAGRGVADVYIASPARSSYSDEACVVKVVRGCQTLPPLGDIAFVLESPELGWLDGVVGTTHGSGSCIRHPCADLYLRLGC